ncbi:Hypothetical predicted protein [Cloeon dipterum]|uniref:Dynein heavy chain AAA 5 extension domain-containing protein n=1 Tax=Cloeon dipterum TaxID=197152 RepID=A0A8S1D596_9INSE|nr:Hypothetical predicted protein [Cloeon dipterum]
MMFLRHIIFALFVLMVSSSRNDIDSPEMEIWKHVDEYMRETFRFFDQTHRDKFLLILGDNDGVRSELSLFLTGARDLTIPAERFDHIYFPFCAVDRQSGVLVIDLPNFDVFHDVYVDLMMAFTHKLILEKAKALQILLVMPDKGKKEIVRFWRLAMKLVAILDENLNDISSAITLVGINKPMKSEDKVQLMLKDVVKILREDWDFMKDTIIATYGNRSEEWIKHQIWWTQELMFIINEEKLFAVFQRPGKSGIFWSEENRKNLRELFFNTGLYASAYLDFKVIVEGRTKDYFSYIDTSEFVNRDIPRRIKMGLLMLILSHLVLMAYASNRDFSSMEMDEWSAYVEEFMKYSFGFVQHFVDNEELILILGDVDGESNELSLFLTGDDRNYSTIIKVPFNDEVPQPFFIPDNITDVLFINMPNFDEFHSVYIDFMLAFMHKLIFERARKLKVWLVITDEWEKEITRFSKLAVRLVAVLDENLEDMLSSITLVGAIPPKPEKKKRFSWHILAYSVLLVGTSSSDFSPPESVNWTYVEEYMKKIFNFFYKTEHEDFLLILGDANGERSELSRFLTGTDETQPFLSHHLFIAVDNRTGVVIFDMPTFG